MLADIDAAQNSTRCRTRSLWPSCFSVSPWRLLAGGSRGEDGARLSLLDRLSSRSGWRRSTKPTLNFPEAEGPPVRPGVARDVNADAAGCPMGRGRGGHTRPCAWGEGPPLSQPRRGPPSTNGTQSTLSTIRFHRNWFAIETKLVQDFVTGAGCIFYLVLFTRPILTMRGPQRFNLPLRPSYFAVLSPA